MNKEFLNIGKRILLDIHTNFTYDKVTDTGFAGIISGAKFISYDELCLSTNFNIGKSLDRNDDWLCFWYKGDILFTPKNPIRYGVSWVNINELGLVDDRSILINNSEYNISLLTNTLWDELITRVHMGHNDKWANLSNIDLDIDVNINAYGAVTILKELYHLDNLYCTHAGAQGISSKGHTHITNNKDTLGWRPVLTLKIGE